MEVRVTGLRLEMRVVGSRLQERQGDGGRDMGGSRVKNKVTAGVRCRVTARVRCRVRVEG